MQYTSKEVYEYISHQTNDPIVEWKTCAVSSQEFAVFQSDVEFYNRISPTFAGQRFQIPTPALCPEERSRRRLLFRNERKLYKRKCDATGDSIISIYSPDKPYKVYKQDFWWSDKRDPMEYGTEFDFQKTFQENFEELFMKTPQMSLYNPGSQNCEYTNIMINANNCYLCFVSSFSENCLYTHWTLSSKDSMDTYRCSSLENCYEINGGKCNINCEYCYDIEDCSNCLYSASLKGCNYCFGCTNLINKQYYIHNKQYTKKEYEEIIPQHNNLEHNKSLFYTMVNNHTKQGLKNYSSENIIGSGNINSTKLVLCSNLIEGENCKYYDEGGKGFKSCIDGNYGYESTLSYESLSVSRGYNNGFTISTTDLNNAYYNINTFNSKHIFGSIGLRNKSYCILNKQYTKEEYEIKVAKIVSHMQETGERGEFFHPSLSPFGYNETVANEYFPLSKSEALNFPLGPKEIPLGTRGGGGLKRQDNNYDPKIPEGAKVIDRKTAKEEPINDEQVLKSIFVCEVSERPYRIIKQELDFYRKHNLPLPKKHPDVRHEERMKLRPGRTLYLRKCDCCKNEILSVYKKDYEGKIYCEQCYQKEVYS